jgi:hypothetical protein
VHVHAAAEVEAAAARGSDGSCEGAQGGGGLSSCGRRQAVVRAPQRGLLWPGRLRFLASAWQSSHADGDGSGGALAQRGRTGPLARTGCRTGADIWDLVESGGACECGSKRVGMG